MKNKLIAAFLVIVMAVTQLGAFAFDDMAEERFSWAVEAVEAMAEKGIIKGYEDGTFRPDKEVTKEEALILVSRICGFTEETSEKYKELATEIYGEFISDKYETSFVDEISYLMYRGVIKPNDLKTYISDDTRTQPLKRYEAAMLMGVDTESEASELTYADAADIPEESKPCVAYVTEEGLMNGMGENRFEPMIALTRAQVATLLYRAMNKLDFSYVTGTLDEYNPSNDIISATADGKQEKYVVTAEIPVVLDGNYSMLESIPEKAELRLTLSGNKVVFVEASTPEYTTTISLIFLKYEKFTDATVLTFKEIDSDEEVKFSLAKSVVITKNGAKKELSGLAANDLVTIEIVGEKITRIDAESPEKESEGIITALHFAANFSMVVKTDDVSTEYKVYDNIKVVRNGKIAAVVDLRVGDKVTLETKYNVIEKITAISKTRTITGEINKIVISAEPTITINEEGVEKEYALLNALKVTCNGETADVYALRLGDTANITIEGETVTKIDVTSAKEDINYTGKLSNVNTTHGYIMIDGVEDRIIITNAKIQDSTGKTITKQEMKVGSAVTVFGSKHLGTIEASLIIVNK